MKPFDTVIVVDWSAASKLAPANPSANAIWIGTARGGEPGEPAYCRSRAEAEALLSETFRAEAAEGRRVLAGFDFPFGYPAGFSRKVAGTDDPLRVWGWLGARIRDNAKNANNRFDVAEKINRRFRAPGPFWGRPRQWEHRYPDLPATRIEAGVVFEPMAEFRACETFVREVSGLVTSSCFQLFGNPTVGGQMLTGLPVLDRLRKRHRARVWPFEETADADLVFAEIWPSLINEAVAAAGDDIRDRAQVRLLSLALARLPADRLDALMQAPVAAREEGWILGAGAEGDLAGALGPSRTSLAPPRLRNDCFALPAGVDWTPVDEALSRLRGVLHPVTGTETCDSGAALGRILAMPVAAARANPPGANSAVDGYGFAHGSIGAGEVILPLVAGRSAAGDPFSGTVPLGRALRVLTGALLPEGVDTVVLDEDVSTDGAAIAFEARMKPGANTRKAGEDVAAGAEILPAGRRLRPPDLALLAATGVGAVEVFRPLRVGVLSTGDEIVTAGGALADPARTYDANRPMLLALLRGWGVGPVDLGHAGDSAAAVRAAFDEGARDVDLILTSGGASSGDEDHVSKVLSAEGNLTSWRIALKPGRPLALATWNGVPVMGLPGNPVAALVCALIFARPAVGVLSGEGWTEPLAVTVPAAFEKRKKPGRREYLRARLTSDGRAEVFRSEGSGRISGLAWADGLVELPDGEMHVRPGDPVRYLPYAGFGF